MRRKIVPNTALFEDVVKIINDDKSVVILTKGNSMLPFIVGGRDSVELHKIESDAPLKPGDIVLARIESPIRYFIHRVIDINDDSVLLKGDGNIVGVERCHIDGIIARVKVIIKPKKRVNPNTKSQQRYAKIWNNYLPLKRYILAILRRVVY
ncbi:MAG: hypothetical protein R3Y04_03895 [Rikenellaceae bacterium]